MTDNLTDSAKHQIDKYLSKSIKLWFSLIGITGLVTIIGAGFYIFTILPEKAVQEAKSQVRDEIAYITKDLIEGYDETLIRYGKTHGGLERIEKDFLSLSKRLQILTDSVKTIESGNTKTASDFIKLVESNRVKVDFANEISDLKKNMKNLSDKIETMNFSVQYRAHVAEKGWLPWEKDGNPAGTTGEARRMEAIEIKVERKK